MKFFKSFYVLKVMYFMDIIKTKAEIKQTTNFLRKTTVKTTSLFFGYKKLKHLP